MFRSLLPVVLWGLFGFLNAPISSLADDLDGCWRVLVPKVGGLYRIQGLNLKTGRLVGDDWTDPNTGTSSTRMASYKLAEWSDDRVVWASQMASSNNELAVVAAQFVPGTGGGVSRIVELKHGDWLNLSKITKFQFFQQNLVNGPMGNPQSFGSAIGASVEKILMQSSYLQSFDGTTKDDYSPFERGDLLVSYNRDGRVIGFRTQALSYDTTGNGEPELVDTSYVTLKRELEKTQIVFRFPYWDSEESFAFSEVVTFREFMVEAQQVIRAAIKAKESALEDLDLPNGLLSVEYMTRDDLQRHNQSIQTQRDLVHVKYDPMLFMYVLNNVERLQRELWKHFEEKSTLLDTTTQFTLNHSLPTEGQLEPFLRVERKRVGHNDGKTKSYNTLDLSYKRSLNGGSQILLKKNYGFNERKKSEAIEMNLLLSVDTYGRPMLKVDSLTVLSTQEEVKDSKKIAAALRDFDSDIYMAFVDNLWRFSLSNSNLRVDQNILLNILIQVTQFRGGLQNIVLQL